MSLKLVMFFLHHKLFNDKLNLFYYYYYSNIIFSCYSASCNVCCMNLELSPNNRNTMTL